MNYMYNQQPKISYYQPQLNVNRVRPVSSIEEVRAASIDFDGSVFYFPDLANKKIYTKQIGMDGAAILSMYELKDIPISTPPNTIDTSQFVTREEFEKVIQKFAAMAEPKQETNFEF